MRGISYLFDGLTKPLTLCLLLVVGMGILAVNPSKGQTGTSGFACTGFTDNAKFNRVICSMHPARIWNTPVADLVPAWARF